MTNHSLEPPRDIEPAYDRRMSHAEAVLLCRYAKAACPQQAFDAYTPDAWGDLLADLRFEDCKLAVKNIVQRQPFVAPAEIRAEVKRVRNKRISEFGPLPSPAIDEINGDFDHMEYQQFMADCLRRIGDGEARTIDDLIPPPGQTVTLANPGAAYPRFELVGKSVREGLADDPAAAAESRRRAREELKAGRQQFQAAVKPEVEPLLTDADLSREPEDAHPAHEPEESA